MLNMEDKTNPLTPTRRLAAIMFTDIVGYTSLMGEDEDKAFQLLKINRKLQRPIIEKHGGTFLKEIGDAILASFPNDSDAVYCAKEIQEACKTEPELQLRIGIHEGEVVFEEGDVYGDGVNIASRLQSIAPAEGIYISETVNRNVENKKGIETRFVKRENLKNVKRPVMIYQVNIGLTPMKYDQGNIKRIIVYTLGGLLILVIAVALVHLIGIKKSTVGDLEKSIAVLPFKGLSTDPEKQYLADGVMDAILHHLSKIEDLRVVTRTSVEKYRNTTQTIPEIARELQVSYVLEGSFQKYGEQARLNVQLSNAQEKEDHVWSEEYTRNYSDIFTVQSEVARAVAHELHAALTPQDKDHGFSTVNIDAYDYFLKGREAHTKYWMAYSDIKLLEKAESYYRRALERDSSFAQVYTGLALVYMNKVGFETFLQEDYLDTCKYLADIALSFNSELEEAFFVRGRYYQSRNEFDKAIAEFETAIELNPNYSIAYNQLADIYFSKIDFKNAIKNKHRAVLLEMGPYRYQWLRLLGQLYESVGILDNIDSLYLEILVLDNDTLSYYQSKAGPPFVHGDFEERANWTKEMLEIDPNHYWALHQHIHALCVLGKTVQALDVTKKAMQLFSDDGVLGLYAYVLKKNGEGILADSLLKRSLEFQLKIRELDRVYQVNYQNSVIAGHYALLGEKEKAFEYLHQIDLDRFYPTWFLTIMKWDPWYEDIRSDPRFQTILTRIEERHLKEREEIRAWLEQEGYML